MSAPARRIIGMTRGVPFPTVASLKAMLRIDAEDDSKDDAIAAMLDASVEMIESYCGRTFMLDDYEQHFMPIDTRNPHLMLSAYPVESVASITRDIGWENEPYLVSLTGWRLYPQQGIIQQFSHGCCWCCGEWLGDTIVAYRGGFPPDAWPSDLVDIVTRLFMDRWNATDGTGSLVAGSGGGGTGEIKSATVDGMRLDYDLGGYSFQGAAEVPPDLLPYAAALARYYALDRAMYGV